MSARDVADRVNHGKHDQPEGERDTDVGDRAGGHIINDDGSGAGKDEREGAEKLSNQFLSRAKHIRQSAGNVPLATIYVNAYMSCREIIYRVLRRTGRFQQAEAFASHEGRGDLRLFSAGDITDESTEDFKAFGLSAQSGISGGAAEWEVDALPVEEIITLNAADAERGAQGDERGAADKKRF